MLSQLKSEKATASIAKKYLMCDIQSEALHKTNENAFEMAKKKGWMRERLSGPNNIMVANPLEQVNKLLEN